MCERVFQTLDLNSLLCVAGTNLIQNQERHQTSYNIGSNSYLPTIRYSTSKEDNHRQLDIVRWGYAAPFGGLVINARIEEAGEKQIFRRMIKKTRCVAIVDGYFEWNHKKEPYVFRNQQQDKETGSPKPLYLAGLVARGEGLIICTKEARPEFRDINSRMPVILEEDQIDLWLDCKDYKLENIIDQILDDKRDRTKVEYYEISTDINNIKNNYEEVIYRKDAQTVAKAPVRKMVQIKNTYKVEEAKEEEKKKYYVSTQSTAANTPLKYDTKKGTSDKENYQRRAYTERGWEESRRAAVEEKERSRKKRKEATGGSQLSPEYYKKLKNS